MSVATQRCEDVCRSMNKSVNNKEAALKNKKVLRKPVSLARKASKIAKTIWVTTSILSIIWFGVSFIDINLHNTRERSATNQPTSWNAFELIVGDIVTSSMLER